MTYHYIRTFQHIEILDLGTKSILEQLCDNETNQAKSIKTTKTNVQLWYNRIVISYFECSSIFFIKEKTNQSLYLYFGLTNLINYLEYLIIYMY